MKYKLLLCTVILVVACSNDEQCRQERYVAMGVQLKQTNFDNEMETYVTSNFQPDSIAVFGLDNDSILFAQKKLDKFDLPLQKTKSKTNFVLYANGQSDTLTIFHENRNNYLSLECGCVVFANIKNAISTTHKIDSVIVKLPEIINVSDTHLEIYYKTE